MTTMFGRESAARAVANGVTQTKSHEKTANTHVCAALDAFSGRPSGTVVLGKLANGAGRKKATCMLRKHQGAR